MVGGLFLFGPHELLVIGVAFFGVALFVGVSFATAIGAP